EISPVQLPDVSEWNERQRLASEKEVLGFYLSSHPLAEYADKLRDFCSHTVTQLIDLPHRNDVIIGGMISSIKLSHTRNSKPGSPTKYANFDLEDISSAIRCIVWPDDYERFEHLIVNDAVLVARGVVDKSRGDEPNLIINELIPIDDLDSRYTTGIRVRLDAEKQGTEILPQIREILRGYPGRCELQIAISLADGSIVHLKSQSMPVEVSSQLRTRIDDLLGPGNYRLITQVPSAGPSSKGRRGR
ncbi:MAG: OB-fold nucleic acid binding domain-containing protein, partial [Pirellulaceae bacterium]